MTLNSRNRKSIVDLEFDRSLLNLEQARLAREHQYWDLVANRLYYALFHAISGLLIKNEIPVKSHKGAVMMFNYHFVRTGIVSIEEGKIVSFLQSKREEGDYNCHVNVEKDDIAPYFDTCERLIEKLKDMTK